MSNFPETFADISFDIAKKFLHTVVVVDDRAAYTENDETPPLITEPGRDHVRSEQEADEALKSESSDKRHSLNAKEIVDAFAEQGLVCAILRPEESTEQDVDRSTTVAERADLVVLDWQIDGDNGATTKKIISSILRNDNGRLRLIAIYTGEPDLIEIARDVEEYLTTTKLTLVKNEHDACSMIIGPARLEVFSKGSSSPLDDRRVSFQDLPRRLIECFTEMTAGLVSNAAVGAISAIRSNTHKLLSNLHKDLSGAYLVQRALAKPGDALEFLGNLVASELHSILAAYGLEDGHAKAIECWLVDNKHWQDSLQFRELTKKYPFSAEDFRNRLLHGTELHKDLSRKWNSKLVSEILCGEDNITRNADLAVLSVVRSKYHGNQQLPMLSLGTLVALCKDGIPTDYMVCIQPRCDSVRLKPMAIFPFLVLDKRNGDEDFTVILKSENLDYTYLKLVPKSSAVRTILFTPRQEDDGVIRATYVDNTLTFHASDGTSLVWLAELKENYAQRIVQQFASDLSRVGLNELEWLRLADKKS